MRLPSKERFLSTAVIVALTGVLVLLAVLQYRWSTEISEATAVRMKMGLHASMMGVRQDLYRELTNISSAFQPEAGSSFDQSQAHYIQGFQEWSRTSQHAGMVESVFIWQDAAGTHPQLLRLNVSTGQLEPEAWPAQFEALQGHLQKMSADFRMNFIRRRPPDMLRNRSDRDSNHDSKQSESHAHHLHDHDTPGNFGFRPPSGRRSQGRNPLFLWQIDENIPALVRPVFHRHNGQDKQTGTKTPVIDWIVVKLDAKFLRERVMPEIANQYFNDGREGLAYQVAIIGGGGPSHVIYSSDSQFGEQDVAGADGSLNIFGPPRDHHIPMDLSAHHPGPLHNNSQPSPSPHAGEPGFPATPGLDPIRYSDSQAGWQLIARNRKGPLDTVVARMRFRNLALSFGVLLLLAASMGMIIIASQRAQKLARLQMDFVAAISHELRTPLAVICSAADNITDGLVEGREQLSRYGNVIKNQGQQLNQLVEQILLFATTRQSGNLYNFRPLQVAEILDAALHNTTGLIQAQQVVIEKQIEPNLPEIAGDLSAFSQCLQNLITNAVKYGGPQPWIGIRACLGKGRRGKEIQISIEDRGLGIEPTDLDHIFEPFYRSPAVTSAQIHGTGLGLPLAQSMAEAMGANLTVSSVPGKGSIFTLHIPVGTTGATTAGVTMKTATDPKYS